MYNLNNHYVAIYKQFAYN